MHEQRRCDARTAVLGRALGPAIGATTEHTPAQLGLEEKHKAAYFEEIPDPEPRSEGLVPRRAPPPPYLPDTAGHTPHASGLTRRRHFLACSSSLCHVCVPTLHARKPGTVAPWGPLGLSPCMRPHAPCGPMRPHAAAAAHGPCAPIRHPAQPTHEPPSLPVIAASSVFVCVAKSF
jgi:hypothetical protein